MSKGLEALKRIKNFIELNAKHWKQDVGYIEEELKALDIIKNKRLNVDEIYHKDYEWYLLDHKNDDSELIPTKEEYDLLKEVLL